MSKTQNSNEQVSMSSKNSEQDIQQSPASGVFLPVSVFLNGLIHNYSSTSLFSGLLFGLKITWPSFSSTGAQVFQQVGLQWRQGCRQQPADLMRRPPSSQTFSCCSLISSSHDQLTQSAAYLPATAPPSSVGLRPMLMLKWESHKLLTAER